MELIFIALSLGCLGFLVKIVLDYLHQTPDFKLKIHQSEAERDLYESQMSGMAENKQSAAEKSKAIGEEIKTLEKMRDELKVEIDKQKKEMARKGRIILRRSNEDSGQA